MCSATSYTFGVSLSYFVLHTAQFEHWSAACQAGAYVKGSEHNITWSLIVVLLLGY